MNYKICTEFPKQMLMNTGELCLSLFMPTHRQVVHQQKDIIVFKNLVKEAIKSFEQSNLAKKYKPLLSLLKAMEDDIDIWNYSLDGLALFANNDDVIIYRIEKSLEPIAIVSNSFHIKPLVQYYQNNETFIILALEAESFALYKGNHNYIEPIDLPDDAKTTLKEALGAQYTDSYQTHGVYGGASTSSTFHGHGGKSDGVEIDREKFFRHVDKFVSEEITKNLKLPLVLVAHKEHHYDFNKVSNNSYLLEDSIDGSYGDFDENQMRTQLRTIIDKRFNATLSKKLEKYHNLHNEGLSSDQLIIVLKALLQSRVDTLLIESDKIIPGRIDLESQQIIESDLANPKTDDLLDDMIQHAFLTRTKVFVLDKESMPTTSGVAAIFKY